MLKKPFLPIHISLFILLFISCGTESTPVYTLTTSVNGEGSVISQDGEYAEGEKVTIEAVTNNNRWKFLRWEGDINSEENPTTITMNKNYEVVAKFTQKLIFLGSNGITIKCPNNTSFANVFVGETEIVNEIEYEIVDLNLLRQRWEEGSDLSKVCVSNITNLDRFFRDTDFNQPIGNWDVSNVTNMRQLFWGTPFNQSISSWDVSNVENMSGLFALSDFNQPIIDWDVSGVTNMFAMFGASNFNQPIGDWDVSNVTLMVQMFVLTPFNQSLENWEVDNVIDMSQMFQETPFNQPIGSWNVSKVEDMDSMFYKSLFNNPIGEWDVSSVTEMNLMFSNSLFNQNISDWCVSQFETEPENFSTNSPLTEENKPVWGTCPE